jgi:hypothetical protein
MARHSESHALLRNELLSRAKIGEITPEEAENEAILTGLGPLAMRPDAVDSSPLSEEHWTLPMALTWIIERDLNAVREVWPTARRFATSWVDATLVEPDAIGVAERKGWELKALGLLTVGDVEAILDEEAYFMLPPFIVPGYQARTELWANLSSGRLPAEGRPVGADKHVGIPKSDWGDLEWGNDRAAVADTLLDRMQNVPRFEDARVSGRTVREIWPTLRELTSEEFLREDWSDVHATLWIAYRTPWLFHFIGSHGLVPRGKTQLSSAELIEPNAKRALLRALTLGKVRAVQNGRDLPPAHWFGRELSGSWHASRSDYFRRKEILGAWPVAPQGLTACIGVALVEYRNELRKQPSEQNAYRYVTSRPECQGATLRLVREVMRSMWGRGKQGRRRLD